MWDDVLNEFILMVIEMNIKDVINLFINDNEDEEKIDDLYKIIDNFK